MNQIHVTDGGLIRTLAAVESPHGLTLLSTSGGPGDVALHIPEAARSWLAGVARRQARPAPILDACPPSGSGSQPILLPKTERLRSPRHLAWVRTLPCSVPGCRGDMIEAHHVRKGAGVGLKPSDAHTAPLCLEHHTEGHTEGRRTFEVRYGVDLSDIAARLWVESNQQRRARS